MRNKTGNSALKVISTILAALLPVTAISQEYCYSYILPNVGDQIEDPLSVMWDGTLGEVDTVSTQNGVEKISVVMNAQQTTDTYNELGSTRWQYTFHLTDEIVLVQVRNLGILSLVTPAIMTQYLPIFFSRACVKEGETKEIWTNNPDGSITIWKARLVSSHNYRSEIALQMAFSVRQFSRDGTLNDEYTELRTFRSTDARFSVWRSTHVEPQ